jgi:hypothetical protein
MRTPMRAAVLVLAVVLPACGTSPMPITVRSDRFPEIEIHCQGEGGLTVDDCRKWGEEMLLALPSLPDGEELDATRIVLTHRTGNARCTIDYQTGGVFRTAMTVAVSCPSN